MITHREDAHPLMRIFHPSDFTGASEVAFTHALKLALELKAGFEIAHVARHLTDDQGDIHWTEFPGVRATLARWGILPNGASREDVVVKTGMDVKKVILEGTDPVESILKYCRRHPPDLLVLATHHREGLDRLLHRDIAEPLARQSRAMTLFVPEGGNGFVSFENGNVTLRRILIPVDHEPSAQSALKEAFFLAAGLRSSGVDVRLLHVDTGKGMPPLQPPQWPNWNWEERLVPGDVVDQILREEAEWSPDLIVLATQGHRDFLDVLRGSTTERVLRGARCPVLAIPAHQELTAVLPA